MQTAREPREGEEVDLGKRGGDSASRLVFFHFIVWFQDPGHNPNYFGV